jgi:HEAT repeat protein
MRIQLTAALIAITTSVAAAQTPAKKDTAGSREPVAHNHKLSEWVADLRAPAPYSRNLAAYEIASLGPAAAPAVPALIDALRDSEASVRYPVTVALREIGPAAKAAIPALKKMYEEDLNDEIASSARRAIKAIDPRAVPAD